jgi:hypothetical protein
MTEPCDVVTCDEHDVLLAVADPIQVPALETRTGELPRVVQEFAKDARAAPSSPAPFTTQDRDWVVARCASSLDANLT